MASTRSRTTDTSKRRTKATTQPAARRTRKPSATAAPLAVAHATIAERAYAIFEAEGGGDSLQHWLRAERELAAA